MKSIESPKLHPQLFFTTQRFKTPKQENKYSSNYSNDSNSTTTTPKKSNQQINSHIYGKKDNQSDTEISLITAETPMQHKNKQFRKVNHQLSNQAFDSTPSRSRRGSRASSIGSGHEALPHPRILPSTLCRHIRTDLPPTMRCRTLLSWSTQKAEDLTYKTLNLIHFKPTRIILEELPKSILNSFHYNSNKFIPSLLSTTTTRIIKSSSSSPSSSSSSSSYSKLDLNNNNPHSKLILKLVKSTIQNFIKGICENQVEINWGSNNNEIGLTLDNYENIHHDSPTIDFDSLPAHPQDLKNERKIQELEDWRTRMSYEDNSRQIQLNRYGKLIEELNQQDKITILPLTKLKRRRTNTSEEEEQVEEENELGRIDTKKLIDLESILEFGRFLRSKETTQSCSIPKFIDVTKEHGIDWIHLPFNVAMISENMIRLEDQVIKMNEKSKEILTSSTYKLKQMNTRKYEQEEKVGIKRIIEQDNNLLENKLLSCLDGIQICFKSLNLKSNNIDSNFINSPWLSNDPLGKRDLLRALSRC